MCKTIQSRTERQESLFNNSYSLCSPCNLRAVLQTMFLGRFTTEAPRICSSILLALPQKVSFTREERKSQAVRK